MNKSVWWGIACGLWAWSALASAQFVFNPPPPKPPKHIPEPQPSLSEATLKNQAKHSIIAQWLLMRWYHDYQKSIQFDPSDPVIQRFFSVGVDCVRQRAFLSVLEAMELRSRANKALRRITW